MRYKQSKGAGEVTERRPRKRRAKGRKTEAHTPAKKTDERPLSEKKLDGQSSVNGEPTEWGKGG